MNEQLSPPVLHPKAQALKSEILPALNQFGESTRPFRAHAAAIHEKILLIEKLAPEVQVDPMQVARNYATRARFLDREAALLDAVSRPKVEAELNALQNDLIIAVQLATLLSRAQSSV